MPPLRPTGLGLVVVLCAASLAGQEAKWKVPAGGLVQWQREGRLTWTDGRRELPVGSAQSECDPVLFHSELLPSARGPRTEPWSLPALGPWLAFDLGWAEGAFERTFARVEPFGSVVVRGRVERLQDGREQLVAKVARIDLVPFDDDEDFLRIEAHYLRSTLDVGIEVTRRVDAEAGLVTGLEWSVDGTATRPNGNGQENVTVHGKEHWSSPRVLEREFGAVDQAPSFATWIEEGRQRTFAQVKKRLIEKSENGLAQGEGQGNVQGPSLHALMLFGLARSGGRATDPALQALLTELHERELSVPSGLAFAILATGWLHAPDDERARRATALGPSPRKLPARLKKQVSALADRLVALAQQGRGGNGDPVEDGLFWPPGPEMGYFDAFQTFAVVCALDEAVACGVPVGASVFAGAATQLLAVRVADSGGHGWCSRVDDRRGSIDGASTACALAALAVCDRRLPKKHALHARVKKAVDDGLAWLDSHVGARFAPAQMIVHRGDATYVLAWSLAVEDLGMAKRRGRDGRDLAFELSFLQRLREDESGLTGSTVLGMPAALSLWPSALHVAPITAPR